MECVEAVECENCFQLIEHGREPASMQKLSALMDEPVCATITEINGDVMDSRCVENAEFFRASGWEWTWSTAMPKLDTKT